MDVDQTLDERDLAASVCRQTKDVGESIGRQARAGCAAEVEVARRGVRVLDRARPEGSDPRLLVPPRATEPSRPAAVGEDAGFGDLELGVARGLQGILRQ
jgi:hypothetical protein